MTSSVFIKTQLDDIGFLEWCFRFLRANWMSDSQFVVCAPHDCTDALKRLEDTLGNPIVLAPMDQWPEEGKGYLHQQYMKMHADNYCDGDLITFMDSDAMLVMPTDVEAHLCINGKPIIWYTEYERLDAPWRFLVGQIMALTPKYEFMRCFPFTYRRKTLKACREHIQGLHSKTIEELIHNSRSWTEFNVIGWYAYVFERSLYTWKHTDGMFTPEGLTRHWHDRVLQFHGKNDWNDATRERMGKLLNGHRKPDRAYERRMVGEEGRPIIPEGQGTTVPGRRHRVPEPDSQTHNAGVPSD